MLFATILISIGLVNHSSYLFYSFYFNSRFTIKDNSSKHADERGTEITSTDAGSECPHDPLPTTRWECPAGYMTNHRHVDGRPLCIYCQCWNPAPFPNGSFRVKPAQSSQTTTVPRHLPPSQTSNSQLYIHPSKPTPSISYEGYNLPPPPLPFANHSSVLEVNFFSIIFISAIIYLSVLICT